MKSTQSTRRIPKSFTKKVPLPRKNFSTKLTTVPPTFTHPMENQTTHSMINITPDTSTLDSVDRLIIGLIGLLSSFILMAILAYIALYIIDCFQKGKACGYGSLICIKHRNTDVKVKSSPPPKSRNKYKKMDLMYEDDLELFNVSSLNRCRRKIKTETLTHQV